MKRYVIVGGVAAGATAAARLRRQDEEADITVVEKGPYVSFANCGLPYYISGDIKRRGKLLLQTPEGFWSRYRVKVLLNTEAVRIDRSGKRVLVRSAGGEQWLEYDKLLLAQGGSPVIPPIPGRDREGVYTLWTIPDMDAIDRYLKERQPADAVVVGGGFVGLEMVEALRARGLTVRLVELASQPLIALDPEFGAMVRGVLEEHGVETHFGVSLKEIRADSVVLSNGKELPAGLVVLSVGVRPNLDLAREAGLTIGQAGGLEVDAYLRTSDPDIYAAGDMIEVTHRVSGGKSRVPLAGPANRQGRIAAQNMAGAQVPYEGALGTFVVKVFDRTVAATGLSEKAARERGLDVGSSLVVRDNHVGYYPGGEPLALKLVWERPSGRLLGAQAIGKQGVEKRVDAVAVALAAGLTVERLATVDFCYAPPYGSANDPLNVAAFAALNHERGFSEQVNPLRALERAREGAVVVDIRTNLETAGGHWKGSLLIPADEVRQRLDEIPRDREALLVSKDGQLGHVVQRQLRAKGWNRVAYVAGGWEVLRWVLPPEELVSETEN